MADTSGDYTYTVTSGVATITAYSGSATTVAIPSQFSGIPVTGIGNSAFATRTALINLAIPSTITSIAIGAESFSSCASLVNITVDPFNPSFSSDSGVLYNKAKTTLILYPRGKVADFVIPETVTTIASNAVNSAVSLRSISFPAGLRSIGIQAFRNCTSLTSISIPNSATDIQMYAFSSCTNLTTASLPNGLLTLPEGIFRDCAKLTGVTNLGNITSIEPEAFNGCSDLQSFTIPPTVTAIGARAFRNCAKLVSINVPDSVTSIGTSAFNYCTALTQINIGQGTTIIDSNCFNGCWNLASITLGDSLRTIGDYAFMSCYKLSTITIPNKVTNIGMSAFADCSVFTKIYFMGNAPILGATVFSGSSPTVYYLVGATGWSSTFGGRPTSTVSSSTLNVTCDTNKGIVTTTPQSALYITGTSVTIVVTPKAGYLFTSWTGDSTSTSTSISLALNTNKTLAANFAEDTGDNDADGVTNFQEIVTYGSNPNIKDSNNDGIEDGKASSLGYSPMISFVAFLQDIKSNPPAGLYNTTQYSDNYTAGQQSVISTPNTYNLYTITQYNDHLTTGFNAGKETGKADGRAEVTSNPALYNLYTATQYINNYTAGQQNVLLNPNTHNLYTTSQIQNMAVGDLVLNRQENGSFVLNYDIEQSTDLQSWSLYQSFDHTLNDLPPDKAFIRIKTKQ